MARNYTNDEKMDMLRVYIRCNDNAREAAEVYREMYPDRAQPHSRTFRRLEGNLRRNGRFNNKVIRARNERVENDEDILVLAYFRAHPRNSLREAAVDLDINRNKIFSILKHHKMNAYKIKTVHGLIPGDTDRRIRFCNWLINSQNLLPLILWSDESHFNNNGISNRKNDHFWDTENPRQIRECRFQQRFSINVWLGILGDTIIGPYFYQGTLNGERYANFLQTQFEDYLDDIPLQMRRDMWFQQDGAPPHNARIVKNILSEMFGAKWIGNGGPINWPARSPDLSVLDFFVWGYLKQQVYVTRPESLNVLKDRIRRACGQITPRMLQKARRNLIIRSQQCLANNGGHVEHTL